MQNWFLILLFWGEEKVNYGEVKVNSQGIFWRISKFSSVIIVPKDLSNEDDFIAIGIVPTFLIIFAKIISNVNRPGQKNKDLKQIG